MRPERKPTDGTCRWIEGEPTFCAWRRDENPVTKLWIHGRFGTGKTYLAEYIRSLVLAAETPQDVTTCCFLDDVVDPRHCNTTSVLRILMHGVLSVRQHLIRECLGDVPPEHMADFAWSWDAARRLWQRVRDALQGDGGTRHVLIIDGLDRCLDRLHVRDLEDFLECAAGTGPFRVLILSRPIWGIPGLQMRPGFSLYEMQDADTANDIAAMVDARASSISIGDGEENGGWDDEKTATMIQKITEGAAGMYRWAAMVLDGLEANPSAEIPLVPPRLVQRYDNILKRIQPREGEDPPVVKLKNVLLWIVCQQRPMKEEALLKGLSLLDNQATTDLETGSALDLEALQREISTRIGELVAFTKDRTYVPAHASVREYLTTAPGDLASSRDPKFQYHDKEAAHLKIYRACTLHLGQPRSRDPGDPWPAEPSDAMRQAWIDKVEGRIADHPFSAYAGHWWLRHAYLSGTKISLNPPSRNREPRAEHWVLLRPREPGGKQQALWWKEMWWHAEHGHEGAAMKAFPGNAESLVKEMLEWASFTPSQSPGPGNGTPRPPSRPPRPWPTWVKVLIVLVVLAAIGGGTGAGVALNKG